uniref:Uncharacterized protein n=1 Tax=Scleropages formosus TaxID=113540 RepID=A0A8C9TX25_SCLFO
LYSGVIFTALIQGKFLARGYRSRRRDSNPGLALPWHFPPPEWPLAAAVAAERPVQEPPTSAWHRLRREAPRRSEEMEIRFASRGFEAERSRGQHSLLSARSTVAESVAGVLTGTFTVFPLCY